jgi:hypothetical protein
MLVLCELRASFAIFAALRLNFVWAAESDKALPQREREGREEGRS